MGSWGFRDIVLVDFKNTFPGQLKSPPMKYELRISKQFSVALNKSFQRFQVLKALKEKSMEMHHKVADDKKNIHRNTLILGGDSCMSNSHVGSVIKINPVVMHQECFLNVEHNKCTKLNSNATAFDVWYHFDK